MKTSFERLIRFVDENGSVQYGEAGAIIDPAKLIGEPVEVFEGQTPWDAMFRKSGIRKVVKKVLLCYRFFQFWAIFID